LEPKKRNVGKVSTQGTTFVSRLVSGMTEKPRNISIPLKLIVSERLSCYSLWRESIIFMSLGEGLASALKL